MNRKLFISPVLMFVLSCAQAQIDSTIAEFNKIAETCEVLQETDLYPQYQVNPKSDIIVRYSFHLPIEQRDYLSGCGPGLVAPSGKDAALYGYYPEEYNPISRIILYSFKKESARIQFNLKCSVASINSSANDTMRSEDRFFVISQENNTFKCQIRSDQNTKPEIFSE